MCQQIDGARLSAEPLQDLKTAALSRRCTCVSQRLATAADLVAVVLPGQKRTKENSPDAVTPDWTVPPALMAEESFRGIRSLLFSTIRREDRTLWCSGRLVSFGTAVRLSAQRVGLHLAGRRSVIARACVRARQPFLPLPLPCSRLT